MTRSTGIPTARTTAPRLFVDEPLRDGAEIVASAEHVHYLRNVLRREAGDQVRLFNGVDGEWLARIIFGRRSVMFVRELCRVQQPEAGPWLVFALLKRDATDLIVRQAVELGVSRLLPVITERTNAARVNGERLRAIAIEAAEQSERLTLPDIDAPQRLDAVLTNWPVQRLLFVAFERSWSGTPLATSHIGNVALLVGPEGGFTPAERETLRRHDFVTPISLGPFVLRAETAAAAGLAQLLRMGWAEYVAST
ncbi:MAG TPA: 16S rRNA (uracil(1498)-N(3))-methyltransferase [Acetobacteraceae bacterium]|nr:16S rRNA (uracil(1498)-N(3))-methyltransferase [Acetobacteraceae bacterium]